MASAVALATSSPTKRIIRPKKKPAVGQQIQVHAPADAHTSASESASASASASAHLPEITNFNSSTSYCDPSLFTKQTIKRALTIPFHKIKYGTNVSYLLTSELAKRIEGHCSVEGYICPNSIKIISHSCGTLCGANIVFDIVADCLICFPKEHSVIQCVVKTITQAGIRAGASQLQPGSISPIEVFLSRDMNMKHSELFSRIQENDLLTVEVIGRRFVLHDTHVTVIAMLIDAKSQLVENHNL
jgi:hypothetical protein